MDGLYPQCNLTVILDAAYVVPLFNQGQEVPGGITTCGLPTPQEYLATVGGDMEEVSTAHAEWIDELSDAIGCCKPALCGGRNRKG